jgi:hypothetical protein
MAAIRSLLGGDEVIEEFEGNEALKGLVYWMLEERVRCRGRS